MSMAHIHYYAMLVLITVSLPSHVGLIPTYPPLSASQEETVDVVIKGDTKAS